MKAPGSRFWHAISTRCLLLGFLGNLIVGFAFADPAIEIQKVDRPGLEKAIAKHHGHVVLVDFWATWCAPCKEMFSKTVDLYSKYHDAGLDVISVSFDEASQQADALEFLKSKGAEFTNFISEEGFDSTDTFDINNGALPHYRLYDRTGKLVKRFASGDPDHVFKEEEIDAAVRELLKKAPE